VSAGIRADGPPSLTVRPYRERYAAGGQASPIVLADVVAPHLKGSSLADVGCGSGVFGYIFRATSQVQYSIGIDFSERAVDLLRQRNIYDEVYLADASGLPLRDKCVDTALSMENMEHLYPYQVQGALSELLRVARRQVVITTPAPWQAINRDFLGEEIPAAETDPDPLTYDEFAMLASYLHVCWLDPEQMAAAGFNFAHNRRGAPRPTGGSMLYWAPPDQINLSGFATVPGLNRNGIIADDSRSDWRGAYVELLRDITALDPPKAPRSLGILQSGATIVGGLRGLAKLGR